MNTPACSCLINVQQWQWMSRRLVRAPGRLMAAVPVFSAGLLTLSLSGCGTPGTPQPPSLKLPVPPTDLSATRAGDTVTLRWTMPRRATDRVPLTGDQRAVICRDSNLRPPSAPCTQVDAVMLQAGQPATYTDSLPPALTTGPLHPLVYTVLLENHKQRSAGPSNPAYTAAGAAPPPVEAMHSQVTAAGIQLRWQPVSATPQPGAQYLLRLHRTRILNAGETATPGTAESRAGVPQPIEQTLEVPAPTAPAGLATFRDHALDRDAALNRTYRYRVERVAKLTLEGHLIEVTGALSEPVVVEARDLFPPAVPQGLQAVADVEGGAIDLSWTPDTDTDLAGYAVYRRTVGGPAASARVSGATVLPNAAWRDEHPQSGVRYAYSVSALDASGNESGRSTEAEESVIPVPPDPKAP